MSQHPVDETLRGFRLLRVSRNTNSVNIEIALFWQKILNAFNRRITGNNSIVAGPVQHGGNQVFLTGVGIDSQIPHPTPHEPFGVF